MVADAEKKAKLTERAPEDDAYHLDREFVLSVEKLQEVQDELDKVDDEESDKILEIEQEYNEIRRPVYVKRNEIIKAIPDFWLTSLMSHPVLCDILSEEDQKIFKYLNSIDVVDFKDDKMLGYSVTFNFNGNPYFEDTKLTKTFTFIDGETTKIIGTPIKWKEGMGLANGVTDEKNGKKRPHVDESFFSLFDSAIEHDEMVEIIKNDLWPNPLKYFNNEADEEEVDEEDSEDDEMENGDEEEDDDEEDS
ncbi:NAP1-related protein 2-like isoform X1 [Malus sylvestris]|uniref:NAP1-related protein 2-like isoform X1 n=1 Tax=Malus sylvestris TaxID=3752 RepID=UPI0021AC5F17|nr:NAP1-related protein 2-like isoform X1 [Malus sylvestris]